MSSKVEKALNKPARVYIRVSTIEQDLKRQEKIIDDAKIAGYYIAGVYKEKASGASSNRPELLRMIEDLQNGDVVIAERIDRITRLPLPEAEKLINQIKIKGAKLAIPDIVDFTDIINSADGLSKIVLEAVQEMLLRMALQIARDDYEVRRDRQKQGIAIGKEKGHYKGRPENKELKAQIISLRTNGYGIKETANFSKCSQAHVKNVWKAHKAKKAEVATVLDS